MVRFVRTFAALALTAGVVQPCSRMAKRTVVIESPSSFFRGPAAAFEPGATPNVPGAVLIRDRRFGPLVNAVRFATADAIVHPVTNRWAVALIDIARFFVFGF